MMIGSVSRGERLPVELRLGPSLARSVGSICCNRACVGHFAIDGASSFPIVVGVGKYPDAISDMRGAEVASSQHTPPRVIPQAGQVFENTRQSVTAQTRGVFDECKSRPHLANDSRKLAPKAAAWAIDPSSLASCANVLAWKSAADDVDVPAPRATDERLHIVPNWESLQHSIGLTLEQDVATKGINLNSADGAPTKQLSAQDAASCPCK